MSLIYYVEIKKSLSHLCKNYNLKVQKLVFYFYHTFSANQINYLKQQ